ncbi:Storkhead-box protein 2, partial [Ophiophagus hannah]
MNSARKQVTQEALIEHLTTCFPVLQTSLAASPTQQQPLNCLLERESKRRERGGRNWEEGTSMHSFTHAASLTYAMPPPPETINASHAGHTHAQFSKGGGSPNTSRDTTVMPQV